MSVDFEKKELTDTQHKSDNDKHVRKGGLAAIGRKRIDYMRVEHIREAMLKEGYVKTFEQCKPECRVFALARTSC